MSLLILIRIRISESYDTTGKLIKIYKEIEFDISGLRIDLSDLNTGLYLVKISNEGGTEITKSIILK